MVTPKKPLDDVHLGILDGAGIVGGVDASQGKHTGVVWRANAHGELVRHVLALQERGECGGKLCGAQSSAVTAANIGRELVQNIIRKAKYASSWRLLESELGF